MWRSEKEGYDDDDPPMDVTGDRASDATTASQVEGEAVDGNDDGFRSKNRKMCPHYRQLTTNRTATLAHSMFTPNEKVVACCSLGGEKTKFGAHDIEDLVSFGTSPHTLSGVAIYRGDSPSTGLQLSALPGSGCCVGEVKENGAAKVEGTLRPGDRLSKLNGEDVRNLPLADVAAKFRNTRDDPIMLDVVRGVEDTIDNDDYSSHAACPYYLSQILAKNAELVFAPYNYVLEPSIRNALGIDLEGSVVVLDEAHNVESTLRESGSMTLPEFELCELLLVLNNYATMEKHHSNLIRVSSPGGTVQVSGSESVDDDGTDVQMYISDVAHSILLFLECMLEFLRSSRDRFEKNPGNKGAQFAIKEWRKFHSPGTP
jgi:Fanconi anemia group J protein